MHYIVLLLGAYVIYLGLGAQDSWGLGSKDFSLGLSYPLREGRRIFVGNLRRENAHFRVFNSRSINMYFIVQVLLEVI